MLLSFHTSVKRVVVSQELEAAKVQHRFFSFIRRKKTVFVWLRLHGWRVPPCPLPPLSLSFRVNNRSLLLLLFFPLSRASPRSPLPQRRRERPADKLPSSPSEPFSSSVSSQVPSFFFSPLSCIIRFSFLLLSPDLDFGLSFEQPPYKGPLFWVNNS